MARKKNNTELIAYLLIGLAVGSALTYFLTAPRIGWGYGMMGQGMMWGQGPGMMQYMQSYRNTINADCSTITVERLEEIGDEIMGQMIGDEGVHEKIDRTHPNIDAMHIMMGKMATGCY